MRDFVLMGDGWEKDGDFNTTFSKTVLPLPSHDRPDYGALAVPGDLESDPVYRRHPSDWEILPHAIRHALGVPRRSALRVCVVSGFSRTSQGPPEGGHYASLPNLSALLPRGFRPATVDLHAL